MKQELFLASLTVDAIEVYFNSVGIVPPIPFFQLGLDGNSYNEFIYDEVGSIMYEVVYKASNFFDGHFAYLVFRSI